jgi:5-methylcytosine-specific restriction enzyme subunit McrC
MLTSLPRRVVRCEEWGALKVGGASGDLSFEEVGQLFAYWKAQTGTEPSGYFDFRGNTLTPRNWSGVAPGKTFQLEVIPIGASGLDATQLQALDRNLSLMLEACLTGAHVELAEGDLAHLGQRLQAILIAFCGQLAKARRKQVIRRYAPTRVATRCIRGRTVFPEQVFESVRRPGYFASEWVSLDEDTAENRFIKAVLARFRPTAAGNLRYRLDEQLSEFDKVALPSEPMREWRRIRFDRLPKDYASLLRLGKNLLDGEAPGLFSGLTSASTEVIYTAQAFEAFAGAEVARVAEAEGFRVRRQGRGQYLGKWQTGSYAGRDAFELIPDIQVYRDRPKPASCVIDAKWKRLMPKSTHFGVSLDDVYQVLTYAVRLGHSHVALAYPWIGEGSPLGHPHSASMNVALRRGNLRICIFFVPMLEVGFRSLRERIVQLLKGLIEE